MSAAPQTQPSEARSSLARGARRVSALTMLSRLLGLVREQVFALTLGAGANSDAFLAAFRIPNLLRDRSPKARCRRRSCPRTWRRCATSRAKRPTRWPTA
jgi:hypothetical protein